MGLEDSFNIKSTDLLKFCGILKYTRVSFYFSFSSYWPHYFFSPKLIFVTPVFISKIEIFAI